jgi:hypothetical protein
MINKYLGKAVILGWCVFFGLKLDAQRDLDRGDFTPRHEAHRLLDKGYCDDSYGLFERLYAKDSLNVDFLGMAKSNTCRRKYRDADQQLRYLIQKDSLYLPSYFSMARNFMAQLMDDSALWYFRLHIRLSEKRIALVGTNEDENPRAWLYIGNIYRVRMHKKGITDKEWIEMMAAYERYLQIRPNEPAQYQLRAFLEKATQKRPDADGILIWDEKS